MIAIKESAVNPLERRFDREKTERFLREYNISGNIEALTEGEARYILSFSSIDALRDRCLEEGFPGSLPEIQGPFQTPGVEDSLSSQSPILPAITRKNISLVFPAACFQKRRTIDLTDLSGQDTVSEVSKVRSLK